MTATATITAMMRRPSRQPSPQPLLRPSQSPSRQPSPPLPRRSSRTVGPVSQPSKSSNPAEPQEVPPGLVSDAVDRLAVDGIERLAVEQVGALASEESGSAELHRAVASIDRLGERDFVATAAMSGRLLDRRFRLMDGLLGSKAPMARQLADLRKAAAAIDPTK